MDAEILVKISKDTIPSGKNSRMSGKKMERINPWLKQEEPTITKKKRIIVES